MSIFTLKNIYNAYLDCRKNKRKTVNALKFEYDLENNLMKLQKELASGNYQPSRSICFGVSDPTLREIFAADFRDRIVHHLLVREINEIGERNFIFDSYACRKEKGTHRAVARLKTFIKKVSENDRKEVFYAQLDISGFFMSIDKNILYKILEKMILRQKKKEKWKNEILGLAKIIIFSDPTENYIIKGDKKLLESIPPRKSLFYSREKKGLPIGNYSSQFFGNLYLNEMDQFIKRKLKARYYLRYVDDFIILSQNKNKLEWYKNKISIFLKEELNLELSENKCKIKNIESGIDFLGYYIKKSYTLVRRRVVKNFKKKKDIIKNTIILKDEEEQNNKKLRREISVINSYCGHTNCANSYNLRKSFLNNILELRLDFCTSVNYKKLFLTK